MAQTSLSNLPADIANRIITQLDLPNRLALAQSCKPLRDAVQEAGRADLVQQSRRPGRISNDPFPTLFELVQQGAKVHHRATHKGNLLRVCDGLPPGDGLLQAAAKRQHKARDIVANSAPVTWQQSTYHGELDAEGRPHGVGRAFCHDRYQLRTIYLGDWCHGKRSGWGTQFFWTTPPILWGLADGDAYKLCAPMTKDGGWYEGAWENDKYCGFGQLTRSGQVYREGLWKNGLPID